MGSTPALQPDNIRPAVGEQSAPANYPRFRYVCGCRIGKLHVAYRYFDQTPPGYCPGNTQMIRDGKWIDPNYTPPPQPERPSGRTNFNWEVILEDQRKPRIAQ